MLLQQKTQLVISTIALFIPHICKVHEDSIMWTFKLYTVSKHRCRHCKVRWGFSPVPSSLYPTGHCSMSLFTQQPYSIWKSTPTLSLWEKQGMNYISFCVVAFSRSEFSGGRGAGVEYITALAYPQHSVHQPLVLLASLAIWSCQRLTRAHDHVLQVKVKGL